MFSCKGKDKQTAGQEPDTMNEILLDSASGNSIIDNMELPLTEQGDIPYDEQKQITADLAKKIQPVINKWLKYYAVDINNFLLVNSHDIELNKVDTLNPSIYGHHFSNEDDIYDPLIFDYSPDKTKYIDLLGTTGVFKEEDGKYYYMGSDDCQEIRLYDRKKRFNIMFSFKGISSFADAAFWVNNDMFILVGYNLYNDPGQYYMEVYNIRDNRYEGYILPEKLSKEVSFGIEDMKRRKIIIN